MATGNGTEATGTAQAVLLNDPEFLRELVTRTLQTILEEELTAHLGATRYERTDARQGYREGHKPRTLTTRVGRLELQGPQDREGTFSPELFGRYQRSEQALVLSLVEMDSAGGLDPEGAGGDRNSLRHQLFEERGLRPHQSTRRRVDGVAGATAGGGVPVSDRRCAV